MIKVLMALIMNTSQNLIINLIYLNNINKINNEIQLFRIKDKLIGHQHKQEMSENKNKILNNQIYFKRLEIVIY